MASLIKTCRHGREPGLARSARLRRWRRCGCQWAADIYIEGRRRRVSLGTDERRARVELAKLAARVVAGEKITGTGSGVMDVAERWMAAMKADPSARPNSMHVYESRLRHVESFFGRESVTLVDTARIRAFARGHLEAGRSPATVGGLVACMQAILRHAVREGLIDRMPVVSGVVPTARPRDQRVPLGSLVRAVEGMPEPWRSAGLIVLLTGLRWGELAALTADDLDLRRGVVHVHRSRSRDGSIGPPKTEHGVRSVTLDSTSRDLLAARAAERPDGLLWPGSYRQAADTLRAALREHGLYRRGRGWHTLRSAHERLIEEHGMAVRDAGARMGHGANLTQTLAYGWASEHAPVDGLGDALMRHVAPPGER